MFINACRSWRSGLVVVSFITWLNKARCGVASAQRSFMHWVDGKEGVGVWGGVFYWLTILVWEYMWERNCVVCLSQPLLCVSVLNSLEMSWCSSYACLSLSPPPLLLHPFLSPPPPLPTPSSPHHLPPPSP